MYTPPIPRRNRAESPLRLCLIALGALMSLGAAALESDRNQPLDINSDDFIAAPDEDGNRITLLSGDVRMVQGSLKASAAKARVEQAASAGEDGRVKRVVLTGSPAHLEQQLDNDGGLATARATQIDYHLDSGIVELRGDVLVVQHGRGEFRGDQMTYDTRSGQIRSQAEAGSGRVHLRMAPSQPAAEQGERKP